MSQNPLAFEKIWLDRYKYEDAEISYYEKLSRGEDVSQPASAQSHKTECDKPGAAAQTKRGKTKQQKGEKVQSQSEQTCQSSLVNDIARAREQIKLSLESAPVVDSSGNTRIQKLEDENLKLTRIVSELQSRLSTLEIRVSVLESKPTGEDSVPAKPAAAPAQAKPTNGKTNDDDDLDLFGSDDDEEADAERQKRLADYAAKKAKKPALVAKSNVVLDIKPWDDETDVKQMEKKVREITKDGLLWGASKFVPVAYGIKKLQISTVIEDEKVSVEELTEQLEAIEDYVQSVDVAAFNKV